MVLKRLMSVIQFSCKHGLAFGFLEKTIKKPIIERAAKPIIYFQLFMKN